MTSFYTQMIFLGKTFYESLWTFSPSDEMGFSNMFSLLYESFFFLFSLPMHINGKTCPGTLSG